MKHMGKYSIYFKSTYRWITQNKNNTLHSAVLDPANMTWKSWQEGCPLVELFGSCFMHKHVFLSDLAWMSSCFPQGWMHPGQQIKRTKSHFLLQFEITFMIQAAIADHKLFYTCVYLSVSFLFQIFIQNPFAIVWDSQLISGVVNYDLHCVWELIREGFSWPFSA